MVFYYDKDIIMDKGGFPMTLEEMRQRKQELGFSIEQLAKMTGVPLGTLRKIFSGQTKSPRRGTVERLEAVLEKKSGMEDEKIHSEVKYDYMTHPNTDQLRESPSLYTGGSAPDNPYGNKKQGQYTIEDYFALPEENRYELIDGVIYDMASPSRDHQLIAGFLYHRLMTCADQHPSQCQPYMSPLDVQLDKDNRTMVQPDVIVCCSPDQDSGVRIFGAPDFLAEVESPSSHMRDRFIKLSKYKNAGVREYWLIKPDRQQVVVFLFSEDDRITIYTFDDDIPVYISEVACTVNFSAIKGRMTKSE